MYLLVTSGVFSFIEGGGRGNTKIINYYTKAYILPY